VLGVGTGELPFVKFFLVEQCKRVMISGVSAEIPSAGRLGDEKAQQVEIKTLTGFKIRGVETKMAEAPDLKWTVEGNAAHVVLDWLRLGHVH
jgi:hypothetical protein